MAGPLYTLLAEDHARLDALLQRSAAHPNEIDLSTYAEFRAGLLRHIAMEEKVLLPAIQRITGAPHPLAGKLRLQHGAIAALLVPSPTSRVLSALQAVLAAHNPLEEGPDGLYATCEAAAGAEIESLAAQLRATPPVPVAAHVDTERVWQATRRALLRAGFEREAASLSPDDPVS